MVSWVLVLCLFAAVGADKYHRDDEGFASRLRQGQEETSASFWRLNAQASLLQKLREGEKRAQRRAKNVILFIGDGMDLVTSSAARMYLDGEETNLSFDKFPVFGLAKTYCVDVRVADSSCSANAYLCGVKNNEATVGVNAKVQRKDCQGMDVPENRVFSIAKWAQEAGKGTGIVTTTKLTDASPSAVYAHTAERYWEANSDFPEGCSPALGDIAHQLIHGETGKNLQVALGCGNMDFIRTSDRDNEGKPGKRTDGRNLIDEWRSLQVAAGREAAFVDNRTALLGLSGQTERLFGMFDNDDCRYQLDIARLKLVEEPTLTEMTEAAIKVLERNEKGYFLFVEGGRIDHAHHDTLAHYALEETAEMARAVQRAREMTSLEDTLIVVSADHGHTLTYSGYASRATNIFGTGGIADDNLPWPILSYANGPGYANTYNYQGEETPTSGGRKDLSQQDMTDPSYAFPATVPRDSETHGGADVGVWASGPGETLFSGVYEQHAIPHLMARAAEIGEYAEKTNDAASLHLLFATFCLCVSINLVI